MARRYEGTEWLAFMLPSCSSASDRGMTKTSATCKAIRRIWNITIYRLVVMSETIRRTVCRKPKERGYLHVGIWIIVPVPTVVSGQVLLDCDPGALCSVHDSQLQFETCA